MNMIEIREMREKKNLTQEELGTRAEISQQTVAAIENGTRRPSVETAKKIAKVLKFKWTKFFE